MATASLTTLSDLVFHLRAQSAGRPSLLAIRRGGRVVTLSTADVVGGIHALAQAMEARGLEKGQRVAIWSENCPEWHLIDLACHLLGAVVVPIYPTTTPEQLAFILKNSGARWIFFSDEHKHEVLASIRSSFARPPLEVAIEEGATIVRIGTAIFGSRS